MEETGVSPGFVFRAQGPQRSCVSSKV